MKGANRVLPPRGIKDIKREVEGDTKALIEGAKKQPRKETKQQQTKSKQMPLVVAEKQAPEAKTEKGAHIPESRVIDVKKKPETGQMIEVKRISELEKICDRGKLINRFEDPKETIYFIGEYFYRE